MLCGLWVDADIRLAARIGFYVIPISYVYWLINSRSNHHLRRVSRILIILLLTSIETEGRCIIRTFLTLTANWGLAVVNNQALTILGML